MDFVCSRCGLQTRQGVLLAFTQPAPSESMIYFGSPSRDKASGKKPESARYYDPIFDFKYSIACPTV